MNKAQEIIERLKRERELKRYRDNQQAIQTGKSIEGLGNTISGMPKAINKAKNVIGFGKNVVSGMKSGQSLGTAIKGAKAISDANKVASTASNALKTADTIGDVAKTADTASKVSKVGSVASKAGTALGAVGSGYNAVNDFSKGNYIDGGLNMAKTAAYLIPGAQPVAIALEIGQMIKGALDKKKQKAMQANMKKMNENEQLANEKKQDAMEGFGDNSLAVNTMQQPMGQFGQGNIDLTNRPVVQNQDGTISTVRSMSFNDGTNEILIPTVSNDGRILSPEEAIAEYDRTGQHLGKFATPEEATRYAEGLHNQQDQMYSRTPKGQATGGASDLGDIDSILNEQPTEDSQGFLGALPDLLNTASAVTGNPTTTPEWDDATLGAMDKVKALGGTEDQVNGIAQGLNFGNKDYASIVDEAQIRKPSTPEEIELAKQGKFNTPEQPVVTSEGVAMEPSVRERISGNVKNYFNQLADGYKENSENSFSLSNLLANPEKTVLHRVGEGLGTGRRLIANPALQGLVAGTIKGINTGDWGTGLEYGVNWASDKAKADSYNKMINPGTKVNPIFAKWGADDYKAVNNADYRTIKAELERDKLKAQLDKSNPTMKDYAETMKSWGMWDQQKYNDYISDPGYDPERRLNNNVANVAISRDKAENQNTHWQNMDANNSRRLDIMEKHYNNQDEINRDKQEVDEMYKSGMLSVAQYNSYTNRLNAETKRIGEERKAKDAIQKDIDSGKLLRVEVGGRTLTIKTSELQKVKKEAKEAGYTLRIVK